MATTIIRKLGDFKDLVFTVDLSLYGKTQADVEDIFFSVKVSEIDNDNSVFLKTFLTSGITFTSNAAENVLTVNVIWLNTEYDTVCVNETYVAGLFVKFNGDPVADENVNQTFKLKIIQDFLRDN